MAIVDPKITGHTNTNQFSFPEGFCSTGTGTGITVHTPNLECAVSHEVDEILAEYLDGIVVAYCRNCHQRVTLKAIPGGISVMRLKTLVSRILETDQPDGILLQEYADCMTAIAAERETLNQAESLIATVRERLERGCK